MNDWKDINDDTDFENILKSLEIITNPKGRTPLLVLKSHLIGNDFNKIKSFKYIGTYRNGKHSVIRVL